MCISACSFITYFIGHEIVSHVAVEHEPVNYAAAEHNDAVKDDTIEHEFAKLDEAGDETRRRGYHYRFCSSNCRGYQGHIRSVFMQC